MMLMLATAFGDNLKAVDGIKAQILVFYIRAMKQNFVSKY